MIAQGSVAQFDPSRISDGIHAGRLRAIGRAISELERDSDIGRQVIAALRDTIGGSHRIGITGPPGAGKSSLIGALIQAFRRRDRRVGVIAIDPSSQSSGGAILGDRVRMQHGHDNGVFIRSLGSRGDTGGLSVAAARAGDVLDAAGYDPIIFETVGVGQAEIEVSKIVHTRIVVLPPGLGDEIQMLKSGLMDIADIFVISKSDKPDADLVRADLLAMLNLRGTQAADIELIGTSTVDGQGITQLLESLIERSLRRPRAIDDQALARLVVRHVLRQTELQLAALPAPVLIDLGRRVHGGEITLAEAARAAIDAVRRYTPSYASPITSEQTRCSS
jgi:LAO/AO transport system kinase